MSNAIDPMAPSDATVDDPSTARLKHEIEQTKEGLADTLSALEDKFSPSQVREAVGAELQQVEERVRGVLADQLREGMRDAERLIRTGLGDAKESVKTELKDAVTGAKDSLRAATLGRVETFATNVGDTMNAARESLTDTIYNNPRPAAVTGMGLLWLLMNRSRSERAGASRWNGSAGQAGGSLGRVAQDAAGAVGQGMQRATDAAGEAVHSATDVVTSIAHTASEGVQQAAHTVSDSAFALAGTAQHSAKRVEQTVQRALRERPLAVGAAAVAIGTMVGASFPSTRAENRLMGEARDEVLTRVGDAVHGAAASLGTTAETSERGDERRQGNAGQAERQENASASHTSSGPKT